MFIEEEDYLEHYGILRRSGRYPWGSGEDENSRNTIYIQELTRLKKEGLSESDIAKAWGCTVKEIRNANTEAKAQQKAANIAMARRLQEKGTSTNAIAKQMGHPEPTVRNWLKPGSEDKHEKLMSTTNMLKKEVAEKTYVDVGKGVENYIGISTSKLDSAVGILRDQGYEVHNVPIPQIGRTTNTQGKILCPPGTTQREAFLNRSKIQQVTSYTQTHGKTYDEPGPVHIINPKRVDIRYANEGGAKADGVIYVRPGVDDVRLGGKSYAQVRIQVGNDHYLKGMAMYKDDLPEGTDLLFNTSKDNTGNKFDAMKPLKADPDLRFGSIVRQLDDHKTKPSAMNLVNEEGDWELWSRTLSTQFLSKQSPLLVKSQLDMTLERRQIELANINKLTNPTVRKKMLMDFAGSTDTAAVHLKAAAMPGQAVRVILPVASLKETQIYAPGFTNGERVILIRHPHGGTFEIPDLVVNTRHAESRKLLGEATDAVGISHKVAQHLSGADFDGDTVLVIPNKQGRIKSDPMLKELQGFDPHAAYPGYPGMKEMTKSQTQNEMGKISNLITDMTLKNAPHSEIARAVKHSMVVIDAEKHSLDFRLSANDNNIKNLKQKYQRQPGSTSMGASTLISRRKYKERVPERKERSQKLGGPINKQTGAKEYELTNRINRNTGKPYTSRVARIDLVENAHELSSGTRIEGLYADQSNKLKALANQARLTAINTPHAEYNRSARAAYQSEYASLNASLTLAKSNAPLERQAQVIAASQIRLKKQYDPDMDKETYKKVQQQEIKKARRLMGADKDQIVVSQREWDAIQAGAISHSMLEEILIHADMDVIRSFAKPKDAPTMTSSMATRARQMLALGYTKADIAEQLGVSVRTLNIAALDEEG